MMNKFLVSILFAVCALQAHASSFLSPQFLQKGNGAVARSYADKAGDFVNVRDMGAKCDGSTDDTAAIQAALSSGAGTVHLPSGVCIVSKVTVPSDTTLTGQGAKSELRRRAGASSGAVVTATGAARVTIANLTVNGNAAGATGVDSNVFITGSYDVTIDNVRAVNSLLHGVSIQSSTDKANHTISAIRNSTIQSTAQYGIEAQDTGRIVIEGNRIAKSASHGILVYGTAANAIQNATIVGNVVVDAGGSGIAIPFVSRGTATTPGVEELTVTGNTVESSAMNGYVIQGRRATVTGNAASRNGAAIYHQGFVVNVLSVTMTGNTATRNAGVGIDFGDCKRVIASANLVEENGIIGIEVNSTEDFAITGNMLINNNQVSGAGEDAAGIDVHLGTGGYPFVGNSVNGVIADNIVRSGPSQSYGIRVDGTAGNLRLIGNDAMASGTVRDFDIAAPTGQFVQYGNTIATPTLTPAASVTIPQVGQFFYMGAGGTISSIVTDKATYEIGRVIILKFNGTATIANGAGNIHLSGAGSFHAVSGSLLTLVRVDGANWIEMGRHL